MQRLAPTVLVVFAAVFSACKGPSSPPPDDAAVCEPSRCGPAMGMPNHLCADGKTTAGPTGRCLPRGQGACGWEVTACPDEGSTGSGDAAGASCGSRGLPPCPDAQFCEFPADSQCGALDKGGVCKPRPEMCTEDYTPVCGCDGQTYSNACVAASKGASVAKSGPCEGLGQ